MRADIPRHLLLGRLITHSELSRFWGFVCHGVDFRLGFYREYYEEARFGYASEDSLID